MRTTTFLALVALAGGLIGCSGGSGGSTTETPSGDKKLRIAVIPKGKTPGVWNTGEAGNPKGWEETDAGGLRERTL